MPQVQFINDVSYIKAVHSDGIVIFYVKAALILQKLSNTSFMFKCDSFEQFYDYADVTEPITMDIDEFLSIVASWNTALSNTFNNLNASTVNTNTMFFTPIVTEDQGVV
jgi:hypothetical protein